MIDITLLLNVSFIIACSSILQTETHYCNRSPDCS